MIVYYVLWWGVNNTSHIRIISPHLFFFLSPSHLSSFHLYYHPYPIYVSISISISILEVTRRG